MPLRPWGDGAPESSKLKMSTRVNVSMAPRKGFRDCFKLLGARLSKMIWPVPRLADASQRRIFVDRASASAALCDARRIRLPEEIAATASSRRRLSHVVERIAHSFRQRSQCFATYRPHLGDDRGLTQPSATLASARDLDSLIAADVLRSNGLNVITIT